MDRTTEVILCNYTKGGAGKTTVAVHIAKVLVEQTIGKTLLVDCDPRPDSWRFFQGSRPQSGQTRVSCRSRLDLLWNPPQSRGSRFKPIKKAEYSQYDYLVIDSDSPPEDSLTLLSDTLPDLFIIPISQSQSHSIQDIPSFLQDIEREVQFIRDSGLDYNPVAKVVPLGVEYQSIESELQAWEFHHLNVIIAQPMPPLAQEIQTSLKERKIIWAYPNFDNLKNYFIDLIKVEIPEVE
ncbi:ParA family protein [Phormidium yuhuli AB48]|uniref:ParA family protein n=1 Tax=Phormidium yuhuli AB48 TaxID=2940671 RepID=A0ABY5ANZ8_9CYAN|nr:ParA family protein [Phormidium yuhuli]USR90638.1 ParA family protein [Phormidium yuhuli AB48]